MKEFLVIKKGNLPTRMPVSGTLLIILALDYWNAPTWLWIIGGILILYRWIVVAYRLRYQNEYDLFPGSVRDIEETRNSSTKFQRIVRESSE